MKRINKAILKENIEKAAFYDLSNNKIFGSAYWVFQDGETVYCNSFGYTDLSKNNPVTEKTLFRLASMTKPITAVAALILVDRGILDLNTPIEKYLPKFSQMQIVSPDATGKLVSSGKAVNKVKIINLLTHTSGIGSQPQKAALMTQKDKQSIENTLEFYINWGLDFEPETREAYSGTGAFDVLVKIIENVTYTDYRSFLKKEIFEPCNMQDTDFIPSPEQWKRIITMHTKEDGCNAIGETTENCIFFDYPCTHYLGGAGLVSSLEDYSKFAKMLLCNGKIGEKQLLSPETFKLLHTPHVSAEIMPWHERWGLGVRVITSPDYPDLPVGAYGWSGAFGSHFWIDPENKIAAVFMKNSYFDGGSGNESARNFEKAVNDSLC